MEIDIAICDDERLWINNIQALLEKYLPQDIKYNIFTYDSGEKCLADMIKKPADILFMDIEMQGLSGIEVVRQFKAVFSESIVFFITSHNSYFTDLFRLGSFQCLLKPIDEKDFKADLNRAIESYKLKHTKIEVKADGVIQSVNTGDILYIEVYKKRIRIILKDGEICHSGSISYYENKLDGYGFVKTHKSFLVNLNHIQKITQEAVILDVREIAVPLSRNFRDGVKRAFARKNFGECL